MASGTITIELSDQDRRRIDALCKAMCPTGTVAVVVYDQLTAAHQRIEELEHTIHQIACDVGAGGFNAPAVDAKLFYDKISDGISSHIKLWQTQAMEAQQRVAELERFARLIVDNAVLDAAPSQWATARFHKMVIDNARKALRK